jgi:hypothetical protein
MSLAKSVVILQKRDIKWIGSQFAGKTLVFFLLKLKMSDLIEVFLSVVGLMFLVGAALVLNKHTRPKLSVAAVKKPQNDTMNLFEKPKFLNIFTIFVCSGYLYLIYPIYAKPEALLLYSFSLYWLVLLLVSTSLNRTRYRPLGPSI